MPISRRTFVTMSALAGAGLIAKERLFPIVDFFQPLPSEKLPPNVHFVGLLEKESTDPTLPPDAIQIRIELPYGTNDPAGDAISALKKTSGIQAPAESDSFFYQHLVFDSLRRANTGNVTVDFAFTAEGYGKAIKLKFPPYQAAFDSARAKIEFARRDRLTSAVAELAKSYGAQAGAPEHSLAQRALESLANGQTSLTLSAEQRGAIATYLTTRKTLFDSGAFPVLREATRILLRHLPPADVVAIYRDAPGEAQRILRIECMTQFKGTESASPPWQSVVGVFVDTDQRALSGDQRAELITEMLSDATGERVARATQLLLSLDTHRQLQVLDRLDDSAMLKLVNGLYAKEDQHTSYQEVRTIVGQARGVPEEMRSQISVALRQAREPSQDAKTIQQINDGRTLVMKYHDNWNNSDYQLILTHLKRDKVPAPALTDRYRRLLGEAFCHAFIRYAIKDDAAFSKVLRAIVSIGWDENQNAALQHFWRAARNQPSRFSSSHSEALKNFPPALAVLATTEDAAMRCLVAMYATGSAITPPREEYRLLQEAGDKVGREFLARLNRIALPVQSARVLYAWYEAQVLSNNQVPVFDALIQRWYDMAGAKDPTRTIQLMVEYQSLFGGLALSLGELRAEYRQEIISSLCNSAPNLVGCLFHLGLENAWMKEIVEKLNPAARRNALLGMLRAAVLYYPLRRYGDLLSIQREPLLVEDLMAQITKIDTRHADGLTNNMSDKDVPRALTEIAGLELAPGLPPVPELLLRHPDSTKRTNQRQTIDRTALFVFLRRRLAFMAQTRQHHTPEVRIPLQDLQIRFFNGGGEGMHEPIGLSVLVNPRTIQSSVACRIEGIMKDGHLVIAFPGLRTDNLFVNAEALLGDLIGRIVASALYRDAKQTIKDKGTMQLVIDPRDIRLLTKLGLPTELLFVQQALAQEKTYKPKNRVIYTLLSWRMRPNNTLGSRITSVKIKSKTDASEHDIPVPQFIIDSDASQGFETR